MSLLKQFSIALTLVFVANTSFAESPPQIQPQVEPPHVEHPTQISPDATKGAGVQNPAEFAKAKESYAKWKTLKKENGDSYEYAVKFQSWVGFSNKTTIVVRDGKIVERRYEEKSARGPVAEIELLPGAEKPVIKKKPAGNSWTEKGDDIGTHKAGAKAKTIDTLYGEAAEILRRKTRARNHMTVRFHANGLLHLCVYSDKNCADDCSRGVRIEDFKFAK